MRVCTTAPPRPQGSRRVRALAAHPPRRARARARSRGDETHSPAFVPRLHCDRTNMDRRSAQSTSATMGAALSSRAFITADTAAADASAPLVTARAALEIGVWRCPVCRGWVSGDEGLCQDTRQAGPATFRSSATCIGQRFKELPNLVWVAGGDHALPANRRWVGPDLALDLRDACAQQLMTAHCDQADFWRTLHTNWPPTHARPSTQGVVSICVQHGRNASQSRTRGPRPPIL